MRSEEATPAEQRQLSLRFCLSPIRFALDREAALTWSAQNLSKLEPHSISAYNQLQKISLSDNTRALVVEHCYADIPGGRTYDMIFDRKSPDSAKRCVAIFRLGIFWRRLATCVLEHGHHQIALFEFPSGVPLLIDSLPIDADSERSIASVALCDSKDWHHINGSHSLGDGRLAWVNPNTPPLRDQDSPPAPAIRYRSVITSEDMGSG